MSTAVSIKKSSRTQNIAAVAILGFGIMVSSFGLAQASEQAPSPASVVVTAPVHMSSANTVGGVLGK